MNITPSGAKNYLIGSYLNFQKELYKSGLLTTNDMVFPDFLCIGAQKAGTTWLYANLSKHPDIFLPKSKELHYFNGGYRKYSLKQYSKIFMSKGNMLGGDMTPDYSALQEKEVVYIHQLMPDSKIILLLRNPIDRAWSAAKMHLTVLQNNNIDNVSDQMFIDHFKSQHSLLRGDYIEIYKKYAKIFGEDKIFVGYQEEIKRKPKALLIRLFDFLEVSNDVSWERFNLNKKVGEAMYKQEIPNKYRVLLEEIYCDKIQEQSSFFGSYTKDWRC